MPQDRYEQTAFFEGPVSVARFIGQRRAQTLGRIGINTVCDLLENFPHRYIDATSITPLAQVPIGEVSTVIGTVHNVISKRPKPKLDLVEVHVKDETGILIATWFKQPWIARYIKCGDQIAMTGKVEFNYGYKRMNSPLYEILAEAPTEDTSQTQRAMVSRFSLAGHILPVHPTTTGITTNMMRRYIAAALEDCPEPLDYLPAALRVKNNLMSRGSSLRAIHFPHSMEECASARKRLAYDEIFRMQLFLQLRKQTFLNGVKGLQYKTDGPAVTALRSLLPFTLTCEQETVIKEIFTDLASPEIMNRMLSGDVGTGKTIVAAFALAAASDSAAQAVMMAPTEVLATQYDEKLSPLLGEAGVRCALLTGGTSRAERKIILDELKAGYIDVLFGTHALLEPDVRFKNLRLCVIDEQHRFGVEQRAALREKGEGVDTLLMTATPIPRTLALALHGELDQSFLRMRPQAHAGTSTKVLDFRSREDAYLAIEEAVERGEQAYVICPLVGVEKKTNITERDNNTVRENNTERDNLEIGEGEFGLSLFANATSADEDISNPRAAQTEVERIRRRFPNSQVDLLTGRMSSSDKNDVMARFKEGEIDILVSTTVVEVGVDVPNATVMLIEDAERFGLSQLHQLRGRVGRGNKPGQVFLIANPKSPEGHARMAAIEQTSDGFVLAELDLKARREGDLIGSRQHGIPALKFVDIFRDGELIGKANEDAKTLLKADPALKSPTSLLIRAEMARVFPEYTRLANA